MIPAIPTNDVQPKQPPPAARLRRARRRYLEQPHDSATLGDHRALYYDLRRLGASRRRLLTKARTAPNQGGNNDHGDELAVWIQVGRHARGIQRTYYRAARRGLYSITTRRDARTLLEVETRVGNQDKAIRKIVAHETQVR